MSIHNQERMATDRYGWPRMTRMSTALVAVVLAMVLVGFGCEPQRTPPAGDLPAAGNTGGITRWTSYTSPTLGITIPYPEGWVARAEADGRIVEIYSGNPPEMSDTPSDLWVETQSNSTEIALGGFLSIFEQTQVSRNGKTMTRVVYPYDAIAAPDVRMVAYLWEENGETHMVGGPEDSPVLEYAVNRLEVR